MTDISFVSDNNTDNIESNTVKVSDTYWGYSIENSGQNHVGWLVIQGTCYMLGAGAGAAAIGLWLVPSALIQTDTFVLRLALSLFFGFAAAMLISYSRWTGRIEWQIDQSLAEIRRIVGRRGGKGTLTAQFGFDSIKRVDVVDVPHFSAEKRIVVTFIGGASTAEIAHGSHAQMNQIANRMRSDFLEPTLTRDFDAVAPNWSTA